MHTDRKQSKSQFLQTNPCSAWQLIKGYWQSEQRHSAFFFFIVIMILTIAIVGLEVIFNYWYNYFYNALQTYDRHETVRLLILFSIIAVFFITFQVYRYYISQYFGLRWRRWLTNQFISRWLQDRGYYYLENFDVQTDNPDQRIQEDVGSLVLNSIDLVIGLISAWATLLAFIYILWQLSGILQVPLGHFGTFSIHGYLVWVCLIYNLAGTLMTFKIGKPLVNLNFEQQRREATFRFAAVDLRSHSENVALYRGEKHQKHILQRLFHRVLDNWILIILRQKLLLWFTAGFNQTAVLIPLLVALPNYFDKVFLLGGLVQSLQAFNRVQDSLSFIVNSYTKIAQWQAVTLRLTTFANHLNEIQVTAQQENKLIMNYSTDKIIKVEEMNISTSRNDLLLSNINEKFIHGKNYLIKGASGIGKSTFVRTLAGIWPFATGKIVLPKQNMMFLPQKPYMPIGTLADAILFPDKTHPQLEKKLPKILKICHLENFIPRLMEVAPWSEQLSPGEQQRIAFARVLLHQPDWVFMDESTSMLDMANEKYLFQLLKKELPHCSVISVGHRSTLESYHDHVIDMRKYSEQ